MTFYYYDLKGNYNHEFRMVGDYGLLTSNQKIVRITK